MQKLLLLGGSGLVGSRIADLLSDQFNLIAPSSSELDVTSLTKIKENIERIRPDLILYAAGFTNVDLAEIRKDSCNALNIKAVEFFTNEAKKINAPFYYLSTDYVFDGIKKDRPYKEEDIPNPSGIYAKSKRDGEIVTLSDSQNCVIRLIMPFSAVYRKKMDIARLVLDKLKKGEKVLGVVDQKINPIFVDDLILAISKILKRQAWGIYHLGATTFTSPNEFIRKLAQHFNFSQEGIEDVTFNEFNKARRVKRPQYSWLDTTKFRKEFGEGILQSIEDEIRSFKSQILKELTANKF